MFAPFLYSMTFVICFLFGMNVSAGLVETWHQRSPLPQGGRLAGVADGDLWNTQPSPTTANLRAVIHAGNHFLAGGDNGIMIISPNGVTWTMAAPTSFTINGLAFGKHIVVAGGYYEQSGRLQSSPDGVVWPGLSANFSNLINAVAYGKGSFVAVGDGGFIVQSDIAPNFHDARFTQAGFGFNVDWNPGQTYRLQRSTDLTNWTDILNRTAQESTYDYIDATNATTGGSTRYFYRLLSP